MDDNLLNASWGLHGITSSSTVYQSLLSADQETLDTYARSLKDYFELNTTRYRDDLNDETERTGVLRECKFSALHGRASGQTTASSRRGVHIEFGYTKATYYCVLYGSSLPQDMARGSQQRQRGRSEANTPKPSLILTKLLPPAQKLFLRYLDDKFGLEVVSPLRLPSSLLLSSLSHYLSTISALWSTSSTFVTDDSINSTYLSHDSTDSINAASVRSAVLKSTIGVLKLTITISPASGIAPDLRSVELEVPSDTVGTLLSYTHNDTTVFDGGRFLERLRDHVRQRTGLILPLTDSGTQQSGGTGRTNGHREEDGAAATAQPPDEPPLRVSRITCAAFAISVDGRVKFAGKPIESATVIDAEIIRRANEEMLDAIVSEVATRGFGN